MRAICFALSQEYDNDRRKKSEVEIVFSGSGQNLPQRSAPLGDEGKRASYAEIQLAAPQTEYKTQVGNSSGRDAKI